MNQSKINFIICEGKVINTSGMEKEGGGTQLSKDNLQVNTQFLFCYVNYANEIMLINDPFTNNLHLPKLN